MPMQYWTTTLGAVRSNSVVPEDIHSKLVLILPCTYCIIWRDKLACHFCIVMGPEF